MLAVGQFNIETIRLLLDAGADLTLQNNFGYDSFHYLHLRGHDNRDKFKELFPKYYKNYLRRKQSKKFKI